MDATFYLILALVLILVLSVIIYLQIRTIKNERAFQEYLKQEISQDKAKIRGLQLDNYELKKKIEEDKQKISFLDRESNNLEQRLLSSQENKKKLEEELKEALHNYKVKNTELIRFKLENKEMIIQDEVTKKELKKFLQIRFEQDYDRFVKILKNLGFLKAEGRGIHTRYTLWSRK